MRRRPFVANTDVMTTTRIIGLLLMIAAAGACGGASNTSRSLSGATILSPSPAPAPAPVPTPAPAPVPTPAPSGSVTEIIGFVSDTAYRTIPGVTITVVDGPSAGRSSTPGADGMFSLAGTFDSNTTFRAEAAGHSAQVRTWSCARLPCGDVPGGARPYLLFYLARLEASIDLAGEYTLTFDADRACTDLPEAVRSRSYAATIGASPVYGSSFRATLGGAAFFKQLQAFDIGVGGRDVTFWLDGGHDAPVVEQLDATTYLAFSGTAAATVTATQEISMPLDGWILYCVTKTPIGTPYFDCGDSDRPLPSFVSTRAMCASQNHRLTLRRRD